MTSQLIWYTGEVRFFVGKERFGRAVFELLDQPLTLALVGRFEIDPEVPPELLRAKVTEITLVGELTAPRGLGCRRRPSCVRGVACQRSGHSP